MLPTCYQHVTKHVTIFFSFFYENYAVNPHVTTCAHFFFIKKKYIFLFYKKKWAHVVTCAISCNFAVICQKKMVTCLVTRW